MSWSLLVLTNPWKSWGCVKGSTGSMKIEQLCIHDWPIGQPSRRSLFMESFVIRKPNPSTKLIACTVLDLSNDGERQCRDEKNTVKVSVFHPCGDIHYKPMGFLRWALIEAWSRSWPSLPLKVLASWQLFHFVFAKQVLGGTGEKPGPTTNGWSAKELTLDEGT